MKPRLFEAVMTDKATADGSARQLYENLTPKMNTHPFMKRYTEIGIKEGLFSDSTSALGRMHDTLVQAAQPNLIGRSIITVLPTTEQMERFPLDENAVAYRYAEGSVTRLSGKKSSTVDIYTNILAEASEEWTKEFTEDAKTGEKAKILPVEKEPSEKKRVLSYAQIRNIIMRSEQYVALYNLINKLALDEANVVSWNKTKTFLPPNSDFNAIPRFDHNALIQLALLDLRKNPIIIHFPAFDSRYVALEISGFDHYCKVPLSTTKGDFKKPTNLLFYSKRT